MESEHELHAGNHNHSPVPPASPGPLRKKPRHTEEILTDEHAQPVGNTNGIPSGCVNSNIQLTGNLEHSSSAYQNLLSNRKFDSELYFPNDLLQLEPLGWNNNNLSAASSQSSSMGYDASVPEPHNQFENAIDGMDISAIGELLESPITKKETVQEQVENDNLNQNLCQEAQELLKGYLKDPSSLQRLNEFLYHDVTSHLISSGRMQINVAMEISRLAKDRPKEFLELFKRAFLEVGITQVPISNGLQSQVGSQQQNCSGETAEILSIYDKIRPILKTVSSSMAYLGGPNSADSKKVITTFGKKLFDAMFDPEEILSGCARNKNQSREYDPNKICTIARFIAWVLSNPESLTIDSFKAFEGSLVRMKETGLSSTDLKYFKDNVVVKYGCDRRAELSGKR